MQCRKGIILAGGNGSRLYPLTRAANKQLLPIYDKPVIYYPLTTLLLAGIRDILIISTSKDLPALKALLGDGSSLGLSFSYQIQDEPKGLPDAFLIGESFIANEPVALILGDNFFHGHGLTDVVSNVAQDIVGSHLFAHSVDDPSRYGVVVLDNEGRPREIEEKPSQPKSRLAVTGLYYFDGSVVERAKLLRPSSRGELEITDLIRSYMVDSATEVTILGRGYVWFDVGTPQSLLHASQYVEVIQSRQGISIASPEEVAWRMGFINKTQFFALTEQLPKSSYKTYLQSIANT